MPAQRMMAALQGRPRGAGMPDPFIVYALLLHGKLGVQVVGGYGG